MNRQPRVPARYHLLTLLLTYLLLPLVLAAPLVALVPALGLGGGYFEMLSCLTTTGATLFDRPQLLAEPLHLWRALVGWMGGLMVLVTAFAILAPLNLGGFEIGQAGGRPASRAGAAAPSRRRAARILRTLRQHRADLCRADRRAGAAADPRRRPALRRGLPRDGDALDQRHLAGRRPRRRRSRGGSARSRSRSSCCRRCRTSVMASRRRRAVRRGSPTRRSS